MNAGELDQRLTFIIENGVDEDGYPLPGPTEYTKAWAKLKTLKGHTRYVAAQSQMEHNREFTIRFQSKLLDKNRPKNLYVYWHDEKHEIESIEDDDGKKTTMTVFCKAVT